MTENDRELLRLARAERDTALAALDRVNQLLTEWDGDAATTWYYANRHSHTNGIGYAAGYSDRWEHDADALRAALRGDRP